MSSIQLGMIAEAKAAFAVTVDKRKANDACWLLYGSFYRLFCRIEIPEGPHNLGWGERYPRDLLAITRTVAGQPAGRLNRLTEFGDEFKRLSIRIPADQSRMAIDLQDIRDFGGLLLEGQGLIAADTAATSFVTSKGMNEDLEASLDSAHRLMTQRKQT